MRISALAALALLLLWTAPAMAQTRKRPSFFIIHSSQTDQPTRPGRDSEAETLAFATVQQLEAALHDALPCAEWLTQIDVQATIGFEKLRQLLGSGDEDLLAALAGGIGADRLVRAQVVQSGGNMSVTISVINVGSATLATKVVRTFPNDGELLDEVTNLANEVAEELAGDLRCPAWRGTVTWRGEFDEISERNGHPYEYHRMIEGSCTTDQWQGYEAQCQGRFALKIKETCPNGTDCSESHEGEEKDVPAFVLVEVEDGMISINMEPFTIHGEDGDSVRVFGFTVERPLGNDPTSASGTESWSDEMPEGQNVKNVTTATWNLTFR